MDREPTIKLANSVEEFAQTIGVSRNHAYTLVRGGQVRAGSRWVIPVKAIERWLEGRGDLSDRRQASSSGAPSYS